MNQNGLSIPIVVRAYAKEQEKAKKRGSYKRYKCNIRSASPYCLIFDTETTTDAAQRLRFGCFQVREAGKLSRLGFFYDPNALTDAEILRLTKYAHEMNQEVFEVCDFIEHVFFPYVYDLEAACVDSTCRLIFRALPSAMQRQRADWCKEASRLPFLLIGSGRESK
jgi:hypothetical protein